jgi:hypothetical protein
MPPETQFNWGLGWTVSVLVDTIKPHSRGMQNVCRAPVLLISVGNIQVQWNFELKCGTGGLADRRCGTFTATSR